MAEVAAEVEVATVTEKEVVKEVIITEVIVVAVEVTEETEEAAASTEVVEEAAKDTNQTEMINNKKKEEITIIIKRKKPTERATQLPKMLQETLMIISMRKVTQLKRKSIPDIKSMYQSRSQILLAKMKQSKKAVRTIKKVLLTNMKIDQMNTTEVEAEVKEAEAATNKEMTITVVIVKTIKEEIETTTIKNKKELSMKKVNSKNTDQIEAEAAREAVTEVMTEKVVIEETTKKKTIEATAKTNMKQVMTDQHSTTKKRPKDRESNQMLLNNKNHNNRRDNQRKRRMSSQLQQWFRNQRSRRLQLPNPNSKTCLLR